MNQMMKRGLSLLLTFVVVIGLLSGLATPASAASYIYNWGDRGQTAYALSSMAEAFYDEGHSYEDFLASSDLKATLKSFMAGKHTHTTSYDETRDLFQYTDCENGGGVISSFYSGTAIGPAWDSGATWNREHTWPDSKGLGGSDEDDIMMLRPTASAENINRGNTAYGESSGYFDPNMGSKDVRGDVARIILYTHVRWGNNKLYGADGVIESQAVLLKWLQADPVDTWEMGRNDAVQAITGTRNVFVDYPELGFLVLGASIPEGITTPSGNAKTAVTNITVLTATDPAMGTVKLTSNGYAIEVKAADGYKVGSWKITNESGQEDDSLATIKHRYGNVYSVSATAACTITCYFVPKNSPEVKFYQNGTQVSSGFQTEGVDMELPDHSGNTPDARYEFIGWVTDAVDNSETKPATIYKAGDKFNVTAATTFHALYRYAKGDSGEESYELVTQIADLTVGDKVVIAAANANFAMSTTQNSNNRGQAAVTKDGDKLEIGTDVQVLTLEAGTKAGTLSFNTGSGYLYAASSSNNYLKTQTTKSDNSSFIIEINSGVASVVAQGTNTRNVMQYNSSNSLFACYGSASQKPISIYQAVTVGQTIYTTTIVPCSHTTTQDVPGLAATCTSAGYTAGKQCTECLEYTEGHQTVGTLGHNYIRVNDNGTVTYTCDRSGCGDTYTAYVVTFSVDGSLDAVKEMEGNATGIKLPAVTAPKNYTFVGWVTAPISGDSDTEPADIVYADTNYQVEAPITLYALFVRGVGGTGEVTYQLVSAVSDLNNGDTIVIATIDKAKAMGAQNGNFRNAVDITVAADGSSISFGSGAGVAHLTLEKNEDNTYSFKASDGYLYASSTKQLKTGATKGDTAHFTIAISDEGKTCEIIVQGGAENNKLQYNSSAPRFCCYSSNQKPVVIYEKVTNGTLKYSTSTPCLHTDTESKDKVDATCTTDGREAGVLCKDCGRYTSGGAVIPAIAHANATHVPGEAGTCTEYGLKEHFHCDDCGKNILEKTVGAVPQSADDLKLPMDANNHVGETEVRGAEPVSCTETGYSGDTYCLDCGAKIKTGEVTYGAHKLDKVDAVAATHDKTGIVEHYTCSVCSKLFADSEGTTELQAADTVAPVVPHAYGTEYKSDEKGHWTLCECGAQSEHKAHTFGDWKVVKKARTTTEGLKERFCTVCGYRQTEEIPVTEVPPTGDETDFMLPAALMVLSLAGIGCVAVLLTDDKRKGRR